jgi:hypothetical protein
MQRLNEGLYVKKTAGMALKCLFDDSRHKLHFFALRVTWN